MLRKQIITLIAIVTSAIASEIITYQQAMQIPSVKEFNEFTNLDTDRYLKQALPNKNWIDANIYLYGQRVTVKQGNGYYKTIPYHQMMNSLKKASSEGSLMAMFQGYRLSSMLTNKKGKYAKRDTSFFARQLMERDVCLGYVETAYGHSRGWYKGTYDWKSAQKVINAGKSSCQKSGVAKWVLDAYNRNKSEIDAMNKRIQK